MLLPKNNSDANRFGLRQRYGLTYVVVLMASLIVSTMALASVETMRWYARDLSDNRDTATVRFAAQTGFDLALAQLNSDPNWRTTFTNNVDTSPILINGVSTVYRLIDEDADLADNEFDNVDLMITAKLGDFCEAWQCTLEPYGEPMDCLQYSVATDKKISSDNLSTLVSNQALGANQNIEAPGSAYITGNSFAVGSITGNVYGTQNALATDIQIPDKECLDFYIQNAVEININDLPESSGIRLIENQLLTPSVNTINGQLSPEGIYYIDCASQEIRIDDSRLECTLVLKKPKNGSDIRGSIFWEASQPNYPILLVEGEMEFNLSRSPLREANESVNFNPPGAPYLGVSDANATTVYPSALRGLIYASKKIQFESAFGENVIVGQLITSDQVKTKGDVFVSYRNIFLNDPPPGFQTGNSLRILPGTVHRIGQP
ncbi:MAG: hypothetical protein ACE361_18245 [Aureliella sp.]